MIAELAAFATAAGVELIRPADMDGLSAGDFREDPRLDYGRVVRRTPLAVLRPRDQEQLVACMAFLRDASIPYKIRGAAHSSGGQTLIEDGAVLDLRRLDRIIADDADAETITVEGGLWWLALAQHLQRQGRRPRSITANLRSSVAGTLAVGGFGDASHLHGLQISHVQRLTLVTPDGLVRRLGPDDELFRMSLAGRGLLGVIAEATLQTVRRPFSITASELRWSSLADFVLDSAVIVAHGLDFVRARLQFPPGGGQPEVGALVGRSTPGPMAELPRAERRSGMTHFDLLTYLSREPPESWRLACPALEFVLPLPEGLAAWPELAQMIAAAGIHRLQPAGPSVMVTPVDPRFPLAPTPAYGEPRSCVLIALRPALPAADAPAWLPALRAIGRRAMELGARMYLMSIELSDPRFLEQQLGAALPRLRALKAELDPRGLLNPGLL